MIEAIFFLSSIIITLVSYAWADHGFISLISSTKPIFNKLFDFRGFLLYNRHLFEKFFLATILILLAIQIYFLFSNRKNIHLKILIAGLVVLIFAYPFLSSDIFSYLFSAKIFYVYHQNPYSVLPEAFRDKDIWLSFTFWTHRRYVYGPFYLLVSLVPFIIFSAKRFLLVFFSTKAVSGLCFILTGLVIVKLTNIKKATYLWFANPLLIIELLANSHNDVFMIFLFISALWFWDKQKKVLGLLSFILSVLTKYVSAPFGIILFFKKQKREIISTVLLIAFLFVLAARYPTSQAWYYTWIYFLVPFAKLKKQSLLTIFLFQGLLLFDKYYLFISSGNWGSVNLLAAQALAVTTLIIILAIERSKIHKLFLLIQKGRLLA
jgi:hypothetical protein